MIEFTTGLALIVSSMYVAGSAPVHSEFVQRTISATTSTESAYSIDLYKQIVSTKDVENYVREQYKDQPLLIEIARCESTFKQFDTEGNIVRGKVNKGDIGVMQINEKYHADKAVELGLNIYTVEGNVEFGKYLYKMYGSDPWISSSPCWGHHQEQLAKI